MVTVTKNLLSTYYKKQWKKKQKATVLVEQKTHATAKTANANVHVAKVENVHAKGNAHAAAIVNKKKKS
ncbi:MAG: hypothetical protein NT085_01570 [candidate division SR1 bacterium]|nr:hypothetical protein [candidate division SR1 bacterium]